MPRRRRRGKPALQQPARVDFRVMDQQALAVLRQLPNSLATQALTRGMRRFMSQQALPLAKQFIPTKTGLAKRSLGVRVFISTNKRQRTRHVVGSFRVRTRANRKRGLAATSPNYPWIIEFRWNNRHAWARKALLRALPSLAPVMTRAVDRWIRDLLGRHR